MQKYTSTRYTNLKRDMVGEGGAGTAAHTNYTGARGGEWGSHAVLKGVYKGSLQSLSLVWSSQNCIQKLRLPISRQACTKIRTGGNREGGQIFFKLTILFYFFKKAQNTEGGVCTRTAISFKSRLGQNNPCLRIWPKGQVPFQVIAEYFSNAFQKI